MSVATGEIESLIQLIDDLCGIELDESKGYLLESRLGSLVTRHQCDGFADLARRARAPGQDRLQTEIIDAITTNETLFFRDQSPFEALRHKILPDYIDQAESGRRPKRLRVWSAACSTGQEPYSLAMTLRDVIPDPDAWDLQILATDVSPAAVKHGAEGFYSEMEVSRGASDSHLNTFFTREPGGWRVKDSLRRLVRFETRNLLRPFAESGQFDIVLCRNVAIYFQRAERDSLFHRLTDTMAADGYLFVGSAEQLSDLGPKFAPQSHCNCTVYRPGMTPAASLAV